MGRRKRQAEAEAAAQAAQLANEAVVVWRVLSWYRNGAVPEFGGPVRCAECGQFALALRVDQREGRARNRCNDCGAEFWITRRALQAVLEGTLPRPDGMILPGDIPTLTQLVEPVGPPRIPEELPVVVTGLGPTAAPEEPETPDGLAASADIEHGPVGEPAVERVVAATEPELELRHRRRASVERRHAHHPFGAAGRRRAAQDAELDAAAVSAATDPPSPPVAAPPAARRAEPGDGRWPWFPIPPRVELRQGDQWVPATSPSPAPTVTPAAAPAAATTTPDQASVEALIPPPSRRQVSSLFSAPASPSGGDGPGEAKARRSRPLRVVLIEDNPDDAALVQALLADAGDDVIDLRVATTRAKGEQLAANGADVVLLDLDLPDSHGLATITRWLFANLPGRVVVMSGDWTDDTEARGRAQGVTEFVPKQRISELVAQGPEGTAELLRLLESAAAPA